MIDKKVKFKNLKSDLTKLRILLIVLTIVQITYIAVRFIDSRISIIMDIDYNANWIIWGFHYMVVAIFIWYNWKNMPVAKKNKTNNTFLILFLGIIGMWLWIPNKRELNNLEKKYYTQQRITAITADSTASESTRNC